MHVCARAVPAAATARNAHAKATPRNDNPLTICDGCVVRIGMDVGGTKIEGIALSDDGRQLARHREPTPTVYDAVLQAIAGVVARLDAAAAAAGPATVGIG